MKHVSGFEGKQAYHRHGFRASCEPFKFGHIGKSCSRVLSHHSTKSRSRQVANSTLAQYLEQLHRKKGFANLVLRVL